MTEQIKSSLWPTGIVIFFVVVFCVNALFLYLSVTNRPVKVSDTPYLDAIVFQDTLDANVYAQSNFQHEIHAECDGITCQLQLTLRALSGITLPDQIHLKARRAGTETLQLQLTGMRTDKNRYIFQAPELVPGHWLLEGTFTAQNMQGLFRDHIKVP